MRAIIGNVKQWGGNAQMSTWQIHLFSPPIWESQNTAYKKNKIKDYTIFQLKFSNSLLPIIDVQSEESWIFQTENTHFLYKSRSFQTSNEKSWLQMVWLLNGQYVWSKIKMHNQRWHFKTWSENWKLLGTISHK